MAQRDPPTAGRLSASDRRARILDAALPLFAADGYERASINTIVRATGTTKPVLYDHFGSKRGLYLALLERESQRLMSFVLDGLDPAAALDARLTHLAATTIRYVRRHPDAATLLLRTPDGDDVTREAHRQLHTAVHNLTTQLILADPAFVTTPGLSRSASASLQADLQSAALERLARWALKHPRTPVTTLAAAFVDLLFNGLGH